MTLGPLEGFAKTYDTPAYWHGGSPHGYQGAGYQDFPINGLKADVIATRQPSSVLDVGCARGYLVKRLRDKGIEAYGCDVSHYALGEAPEAVRPYLQQAWAHQLPFEDRSIDLLVSFGMLEHLPPELLPQTIAEFARVARRGLLSISLATEPGVKKEEHPSLLRLEEWQALLPPGFDVVGDALETWQAWTGDTLTLVGPGILPLGSQRYGGIERLVVHFARGLRERGWNVRVVGPQGSALPQGTTLYPAGPAQQDFSEPGLKGGLAAALQGAKTKCVLDFSHSHPSRAYATLPTLNPIWHDPVMMPGLSLPGNLVALSMWQAERLGARKAIVLDPICYDEGFYHLPGGSAAQQEDRVLFIGKLHPSKGALEAIRICSMGNERLDIIGPITPGDPPEYAQAVLAACDGQDIRYLGEVDEETKREAIWRSKALLYPVSYPAGQGESHSHKMVEVMACGVPCVAYDQGSMREVIEDGVTGYVATGAREAVAKLRATAGLSREACAQAAQRRWGLGPTMERWLPVIEQVSRGARW